QDTKPRVPEQTLCGLTKARCANTGRVTQDDAFLFARPGLASRALVSFRGLHHHAVPFGWRRVAEVALAALYIEAAGIQLVFFLVRLVVRGVLEGLQRRLELAVAEQV